MATVTSFTAARMLEIENTTVVDGHLDGDDLILVTREGTEINAGDVRGPVGPQGPSGDVGDIKSSVRTAIPGYLALNGQIIVGANAAYPDLWALAEIADWKSGTQLNLPDMTDCILQGASAGGANLADITGTNTKVLDPANLPPHAHTGPAHIHSIAHDHAGFYSSNETVGHSHTIDHDHAAFYTTDDGNNTNSGGHVHDAGFRSVGENVGGPGKFVALDAFNGEATVVGAITRTFGRHTHLINVPYYSGSSGGQSVTHQHYIEIPLFNGNTGGATAGDTGNGPGVSTPVNVEQKSLRVNWFIRY